jgi:hypothetical protein
MPPGRILEALGPYAGAATALAPVAISVALRLIFGKNRATTALLAAATAWFAANVLMTPYSSRMQQDIATLRATLFR